MTSHGGPLQPVEERVSMRVPKTHADFPLRPLYSRVWSTPMSKLARELDISDVGLAKACRRHSIPRPPRGYWARLAAGKSSWLAEQTRLLTFIAVQVNYRISDNCR